jgi:hypothetical protein
MHELSHNHSKNLKHVHPLLCVGPYKKTYNNIGPFPNILNTMEVFSSRFFSFHLLDQILVLLFATTQNQNKKPRFLVFPLFSFT